MSSPDHAAPPPASRATAIWTLLLISSVIYFFTTNDADNDLWGHILFGRDILASGTVTRVDPYAYTTAGHAWVNHEWLSQVLLSAVYQTLAAPGLVLLKLCVGALTTALLLTMIRRRTEVSALWGALSLLTIAVLARGFAFRPQIFTYGAVALLLAILDRAQRRGDSVPWILPAMFFVWANLHGGFALGLAILGLFAAAALVRDRPTPQPAFVWAGSALVCILNPNGPRLLPYVWNELSRTHPITEWQASHVSDPGQLAFFGLLALFVITVPFFRRWRVEGWQVVLAAGMGYLAVRHQRHAPVFAMCAAAPLAVQIDSAARWLRPRVGVVVSSASRRLIGGSLVLLALLQLVFCSLRWRRDGLQIVFDPTEYPTAAVAVMRAAGLHANLAVPLDWGEYVLWFLAPQVKVSLDGRFATLFPEQVVQDNFDFFAGAPTWGRLLDEYPTDAVLVPVASACPIKREAGWVRAYGDAVAEIYLRADRAATVRLNLAAPQPSGRFPE